MLKPLAASIRRRRRVDAFDRARRAGFDNINLDFIFGLPGQDLAHWERHAAPGRSSWARPSLGYSLIVEEHTPLWKQVDKGRVVVPDEDAVGDMYELARPRWRRWATSSTRSPTGARRARSARTTWSTGTRGLSGLRPRRARLLRRAPLLDDRSAPKKYVAACGRAAARWPGPSGSRRTWRWASS